MSKGMHRTLIMGPIPLIIVTLFVAEIVGQLFFYPFKFGWKTVLLVLLLGLILLLIAAAIAESTTAFDAPITAPGTVCSGFVIWILIRMYARKNSMRSVVADKGKLKSTPQSVSVSKTPRVPKKVDDAPPRTPDPPPPKRSLKGLDDEQLYAIAWQEVEEDNPVKGLWAMVFAENDGDENKTTASYLKLRVGELKEQGKVERAKWEENEGINEEAREKLYKQLSEEEKILYLKLKAVTPLAANEQYLSKHGLFFFKQAMDRRDHEQVLRIIRNGADPKLILNDTDQLVWKALTSDTELKSILTVAKRLWDKELITKDGLVE